MHARMLACTQALVHTHTRTHIHTHTHTHTMHARTQCAHAHDAHTHAMCVDMRARPDGAGFLPAPGTPWTASAAALLVVSGEVRPLSAVDIDINVYTYRYIYIYIYIYASMTHIYIYICYAMCMQTDRGMESVSDSHT